MKKPLSNPPTDAEILQFFNARAEHPLIDDAEALQPGPHRVRLQLAPMGCWRCSQLIKAVRAATSPTALLYHSQKCDS